MTEFIMNNGIWLLGVSISIILVFLKISRFGCGLKLHKWKKTEPKLTGQPDHDYLFRECSHCDKFQTKSGFSNFKWVTI